ncbi:uncharacterized protein LY79DRAFT_544194 [Colletotrichum navitas]|uniref:Uncharacterized protein n=1 Tax=Colletotrichum navitas TaxID=681940 RepID=A0AAD8V8Z8_9PEZI|nr:uncharacterized protein LY79DRAFT_544194 [Colletotrichum navitas]KAK1596256.1 hypothetical protein LY79DRAFT_544194 [Colletotrichum navitas]
MPQPASQLYDVYHTHCSRELLSARTNMHHHLTPHLSWASNKCLHQQLRAIADSNSRVSCKQWTGVVARLWLSSLFTILVSSRQEMQRVGIDVEYRELWPIAPIILFPPSRGCQAPEIVLSALMVTPEPYDMFFSLVITNCVLDVCLKPTIEFMESDV